MKKILFLLFLFLSSHAFSDSQETTNSFAHLVPDGYIILEEIKGDLNKDNQEDVVLLVQRTNKTKIVDSNHPEELNLYPRGIIIAIKNKEDYSVVLQNLRCFHSDNEHIGSDIPPYISIEINKGNLYIHYGHGRHGFWVYTFRYQNSDFQLIGYDRSENNGPITNRFISINFITNQLQIKKNKSDEIGEEDDLFNETWHKLSLTKLTSLDEIDDFQTFDRMLNTTILDHY